jgi:hypothetical protein
MDHQAKQKWQREPVWFDLRKKGDRLVVENTTERSQIKGDIPLAAVSCIEHLRVDSACNLSDRAQSEPYPANVALLNS